MATTIIRLFEEASTAHQALEALAAEGFPRDGLNLMAHQEYIDAPEGMAGWAPRVVAVPGVGAILAIGTVGAALSGMAGVLTGGMQVDMHHSRRYDERHLLHALGIALCCFRGAPAFPGGLPP